MVAAWSGGVAVDSEIVRRMSNQPLNPWYCLRTQVKREAIAAKHLREIATVKVLCPMLKYRKATRRGKIWWQEAMFPGYVLAQFDMETQERSVMYCQGVAGIVRFGGKVPQVPTWFIDDLQSMWQARSQDDVMVIQPELQVGDEVELAHGPLQGMRGVVLELKSGVERVKIMLEFMGQAQKIDVDLFALIFDRKPII